MSKKEMTRAKMLGDYPYSLNGIDEKVARKGSIVDLPDRHFKIAKGKGLAESAKKGAKTEEDHAADKALAVVEKSAAAVAAGGEEALEKILDEHKTALEEVVVERDGLKSHNENLTSNYNELLVVAKKHVPEKDLDDLGKSSWEKLVEFGKSLVS